MVFLEMATLGVAALGMMGYRERKILDAKIYELKRKYGEHPDIDEAFDDICKVAGEEFKLPCLNLGTQNPGIYPGKYFDEATSHPHNILKQFFITDEEYNYFVDKYQEEHERQVRIIGNKLRSLYKEEVEPIYRSGRINYVGKKRLENRIFKSKPLPGQGREHFKEILDDMCENTLWGEIFEAGPKIIQSDFFKLSSEWYIKEEVYNKIKHKEAYDILYEASYHHIIENHFKLL